MARKSKLSLAKPKIESYFNKEKNQIYTPAQLERIFRTLRYDLDLPSSCLFSHFLLFLEESSNLKEITLDFSNPITRYFWGNLDSINIYELAISLKNKSYLSHYTAMFFNNLTEQIPKNIFVSYEQPEKNTSSELQQNSIDQAFRKPVRGTTNISTFNNYKITLLNGKFTNNNGITNIKIEDRTYLITNLERTLIDITVRPIYSGGVLEVLKAYQNAKDALSVNKLKAYLKNLKFIYPYHQAVGFYLEMAGVSDKRLSYIENSFEKIFDFYLVHNMKDMSYSKRWKLYYPSIFDQNNKEE